MHFPRRSVAACVVSVALLAGVAGCGETDDTSSDATTTTEAETTTTAEATTTTEAETTTTEAPDTTPDSEPDDLTAAVEAALLRAADVSDALADGEWSADSDDDATPCGAEDPDVATPPTVHVGSYMEGTEVEAALQEDLRLYADPAVATVAMEAARGYLDCTEADFGGTPATLGEAQDLGGISDNVTEGFAKEITSDTFEGAIAVIRVEALLITFQFVNATGADLTALPDPAEVIVAGVDKAAAA